MASSLSKPSMMGAGPSSRGSNGSTAGVLRIQQELNTLMKEPVPFIFVNADEGDISKITALIVGPLETPYAVRLYFLFPYVHICIYAHVLTYIYLYYRAASSTSTSASGPNIP